jgi:glutathione S-transferase
MSLTLYSHPFASYCQKVLIALWENEIAFTYRHLEEAGAAEERAALWPLGRFPVLVDDGRTVAESSIIIEHLDLHHGGPVRLLPDDRDAALEVRFMDRFFDNYVMTAMQKPVFEALRAEGARKQEAMAEAGDARHRIQLARRQDDRAHMGGRRRVQPPDCAAAPAPSMPTGPSRSLANLATFMPIDGDCLRGRHLRGR